ncbi:diuretic hormone 41 isoform X2 [Pectinophora gossypiella]|uniref:diuretic hormone 41 isoform X2 n=1 Tax=Pectinophora gossypiella TaxID=13191 RepID=UPI00214E90A3|nr:diuretic hormone 41 isoform X2 [Pectinophora gossypiella]
MMWWAVWCAAVAAAGAGAAAAPAPDSLAPLPPLDLVQIDQPAPDDESLGYAVPPMGGRYSGGGAPWLYYLAEPHDSQGGSWRVKRRMPSLSIDLPMSVLRQKLSLEKERKVQALRAAANRNYLNDIGKRGFQWAPSLESGRFF